MRNCPNFIWSISVRNYTNNRKAVENVCSYHRRKLWFAWLDVYFIVLSWINGRKIHWIEATRNDIKWEHSSRQYNATLNAVLSSRTKKLYRINIAPNIQFSIQLTYAIFLSPNLHIRTWSDTAEMTNRIMLSVSPVPDESNAIVRYCWFLHSCDFWSTDFVEKENLSMSAD